MRYPLYGSFFYDNYYQLTYYKIIVLPIFLGLLINDKYLLINNKKLFLKMY